MAHSILLPLVLSVLAAAAGAPQVAERKGMRLGAGNALKLELSSGLQADSNPTYTSLSETLLRLKGPAPPLPASSPGLGLSVGAAVDGERKRRFHDLSIKGSARMWSMHYAAQGAPAWVRKLRPDGSLPAPYDYWPQARLGLEGLLDGQWTVRPGRRWQASLSGQLGRSAAPTPELLGTLLGRTSVGMSGASTQYNLRRTLRGALSAGTRVDVFDNIFLDVGSWLPGGSGPPLGVTRVAWNAQLGAVLERQYRGARSLYVRAGVTPAIFADVLRVSSASLPATAVAGGAWQPRKGTGFRLEMGAWIPGTLCPNSLLGSCGTANGTGLSPRAYQDVGLRPQLVGMLQWNQVLTRRWLLDMKILKDGRLTPFYAYVSEKRVDASLTGQLTPSWRVRGTAAAGLVAYGAPFQPTTMRSVYPSLAGLQVPQVVQQVGRQDVLASLDASLRWTAKPWLALSAQQTLLLLMTSAEFQGADGVWRNPSLFRSVTLMSAQLTW